MSLPLALDESIHSMSDILRAYKDDVDAIIGLKLSKVGGISHMKEVEYSYVVPFNSFGVTLVKIIGQIIYFIF